MPKKPNTASRRGKGLSKKLGPFPTYVWLLIGVILVVGYIYYRRRQNQTSAGSQNQAIIPSGVVVPPTQTSNNQGSGDTSGGQVNFPSDYATQSDLANAITSINDSTTAAIAGITFPQPQPTPMNPNPPAINITIPASSVHQSTTKSKTAAKKAVPTPTHIRYYTLKKNVPLKAGQKLGFAKNKGYYARNS